MCEHAAWGGGSRPLHLRPVDTICFKLGLQNDGDNMHAAVRVKCMLKIIVVTVQCI